MKSNNIAKCLIALCCIAGLSSCDITLYPEDKITPDTYFRNETDLELFTNSFYTYLPSTEIYQDEADIIINPILMEEMSGQRVVPESGGAWKWTQLRQINYFLANSYHCEDEEVLNHYNGLARFFRAYFYYEKVKRFGDVPWYDAVVGSADTELLNKPRDSRKLVMDNVLKDLDFAIANLRTTKDVYRISKWTALALKSRIMLFEGTFRKYHKLGDWETCLEESVKASQELIADGGYSLHSSYETLFTASDATNVQKEYILARDYNYAAGLTHGVQAYVNSQGAGCAGVTKRLVDAYLMKDGTRHTDRPGYKTMTLAEEVKNRDGRLAATIRTPGYTIDGKQTSTNLNVAKLGYHLRKYYVGLKYESYSEVNLPIFRLGEVYLNHAEALAELGKLTQTELDKTVNKLRSRAGVTGNLNMEIANANPDPWLKAAATGYPNLVENAAEYGNDANLGVILEIRRERTVELVMEGFRYYDIMRWREGKVFDQPFVGMYIPGPGVYDFNGDGTNDFNIYTDSNPGNPNAGGTQLKIGSNINVTDGDHGNLTLHTELVRNWNEDRDYYYPIPIKERILTNGALQQNPGWNDGLPF